MTVRWPPQQIPLNYIFLHRLISHKTTYLYDKLKEQWVEYWQRHPDMAHVPRAVKVPKVTGSADLILATWPWK